MDSPPATLKPQSTQSRFFLSLSAERPRISGMTILFQRFKGWPPESENNSPAGKKALYPLRTLIEVPTVYISHHEVVEDFHLPPLLASRCPLAGLSGK